MINIEGLNRAEILAALYNNSKPLGMGILHYKPDPMTRDEAQALLDTEDARTGVYPQGAYFDYLKGRVMKVLLKKDGKELNPRLYDRDLGEGAAERVIAGLRK